MRMRMRMWTGDDDAQANLPLLFDCGQFGGGWQWPHSTARPVLSKSCETRSKDTSGTGRLKPA